MVSAAETAKKEKEAAKRAQRRAAQKANKKALKEADAEQSAKFAAIRAEEASKPIADEPAAVDNNNKAEDDEEDGEDKERKVKKETAELAPGVVGVQVKHENGVSVSVEYIRESLSDVVAAGSNAAAFAEFAEVFERFQKRGEESIATVEEEESAATREQSKDERIDAELRGQGPEIGPDGEEVLSRRKQKERDRLAISDLKQLVAKPDVVELHDANSADPKLLVYLKSYRNTVPVPVHWSQKRKYLQNKRGFEKPPFQLPACIENTGITKMRGAQQEKDATATNKQRQRAKMAPKMGRIDIDYQILHDAFFRYQTKPAMTNHGDLYYEGRELEVKMTEKKPGVYSQALREALGMKDELSPPPWLIAQQRIGPPPAYPNLAIPGVSAPIPTGARYGFAENEWGKPPVDATGRPLYGDVFGVEKKSTAEIENIDIKLWGCLADEEEEEAEAEEEEAEEEQPDESKEAAMEEDDSGLTSTVSGMTTPEVLNLRKAADGTGTETPNTIEASKSKPLYQVLEEKRTSVGGGMFGSSHTYAMPSGDASMTDQERHIQQLQAKARGQVDVNINPEELEGLDGAALKRKYEAQLAQQNEAGKKQLARDEDDDEDADGRKKKKRKGGEKEKFKF